MGFYKNQDGDLDNRLRIIYKTFNSRNTVWEEKYKTRLPKKIIFFEVGKLLSQERNAKDVKHLTKWDGQTQLTFTNGEKFIVRDEMEELARQL